MGNCDYLWKLEDSMFHFCDFLDGVAPFPIIEGKHGIPVAGARGRRRKVGYA